MVLKVARLLQLLGLLLLPIAMAGNLADPQRMGVWPMLALTGIGLGVFVLGWFLQQAVRPE